jgi:hypothetical protein
MYRTRHYRYRYRHIRLTVDGACASEAHSLQTHEIFHVVEGWSSRGVPDTFFLGS